VAVAVAALARLALPADPAEARQALADLWQQTAVARVEVACSGGRGRTGTALACLAILDGVPAADAVGMWANITTRGQWKRPGSAGSLLASDDVFHRRSASGTVAGVIAARRVGAATMR